MLICLSSRLIEDHMMNKLHKNFNSNWREKKFFFLLLFSKCYLLRTSLLHVGGKMPNICFFSKFLFVYLSLRNLSSLIAVIMKQNLEVFYIASYVYETMQSNVCVNNCISKHLLETEKIFLLLVLRLRCIL